MSAIVPGYSADTYLVWREVTTQGMGTYLISNSEIPSYRAIVRLQILSVIAAE